jgi:hypothetical protein
VVVVEFRIGQLGTGEYSFALIFNSFTS